MPKNYSGTMAARRRGVAIGYIARIDGQYMIRSNGKSGLLRETN